MGEHADDAVNRLMGGDAWGDHGFFTSRKSAIVECSRCGSRDVRWRQQDARRRARVPDFDERI